VHLRDWRRSVSVPVPGTVGLAAVRLQRAGRIYVLDGLRRGCSVGVDVGMMHLHMLQVLLRCLRSTCVSTTFGFAGLQCHSRSGLWVCLSGLTLTCQCCMA
jgi:hypothetical protein